MRCGCRGNVDQDLRERVEGALREAWRKPVRVTEAERLSTGANQEIWALTAVSEGSETSLILRRPPGSEQEDELASSMLTGKQVEIELQRTLHGLGINVPEVIAELDDDAGAGTAFIMERLPGVAVPQKILGDDSYADARSVLIQQMADSLARVHNVSTADLPTLPSLTTADQLHRFRAIVDGCELQHPGLASRGELFEAYGKTANVDVDAERVRFWEAFGNVRWAVICLLQVRRFLIASPEDSHIEHAAIGRRLDEALYDFFRLIDDKEYPL